MDYSNQQVRRQDRLLDEVQALGLLETGEYGVLSLATPNGLPYGIPLNYVWDGGEKIYFHCATEGRKLEMVKHNPQASFCVVGATNVIPEKFSTGYESIVLTGSIVINLPEGEKTEALTLLVKKYSPNFKEAGEKYIERLFLKTDVMCFTVDCFSGKSKQM
jgi:uncharacterized protein